MIRTFDIISITTDAYNFVIVLMWLLLVEFGNDRHIDGDFDGDENVDYDDDTDACAQSGSWLNGYSYWEKLFDAVTSWDGLYQGGINQDD